MSIANFDINIKFSRLSSKNLTSEYPDFSIEGMKELESSYRYAAKGFSEELANLKCYRLCTFTNVYTRPTSRSIIAVHIDRIMRLKTALDSYISYEGGLLPLTLTGHFVDMPDGRYHYVEIPTEYRNTTKKVYQKYKNIKKPQEVKTTLGDGFKFGFVREDLVKMPIKYKESFYINNKLKPLPVFYNYKYEYTEYKEKGYSYLYMLTPRYIYDDKYHLYRALYPESQSRVTAYANDGNTNFIEELRIAEEIKNEEIKKEEEKKETDTSTLLFGSLFLYALYKI